jgi:hypothetical protein
MILGTTGYVERSRVQSAVRRTPTYAYVASERAGAGAAADAAVAHIVTDPAEQAARYLEALDPEEAEWARQEAEAYEAQRAVTARVIHKRDELLVARYRAAQQQASASSSGAAASAPAPAPVVPDPLVIRQLLPVAVVRAVEEEVNAFRQLLLADLAAKQKRVV